MHEPTKMTTLLTVRLRRGASGLGIATKGTTILECLADGQAAADALLEAGDEVVGVDGVQLGGKSLGQALPRGSESYELAVQRRDEKLALSVSRLLSTQEVAIAAAAGTPVRLLNLRLVRGGANGLGLDVSGLNVLKRVVPGSSADATGEWRVGDVIVSVNGRKLGGAKLVAALPKEARSYAFGVLRAEGAAGPSAPAAPVASGQPKPEAPSTAAKPVAAASKPAAAMAAAAKPAAPKPAEANVGGGGGLFGGLFGGGWGGGAATVKLGGEEYRLGKQIGEGGYSVVLEATQLRTRARVAVKRAHVADEEAEEEVQREVYFWSRLCKGRGSEHVVRLLGSSEPDKDKFVYLVMEMCAGGHLWQYVEARKKARAGGGGSGGAAGAAGAVGAAGAALLDEKETASIVADAAAGLAHLHGQSPPVTHRDVKLENILHSGGAGGGGVWKLCDFGSCSEVSGVLSSRQEILEEQAEIERNSTAMYRAPELSDLYSGLPLGPQVDLWASMVKAAVLARP